MTRATDRAGAATAGAPSAPASAASPDGPGNVLVVNAGSSSVKLRLLAPDDQVLAAHDLRAAAGRPDPDELEQAVEELAHAGEVAITGHRVVHGGSVFTDPVLVDDEVEGQLRALVPLAPLHQPAALAALADVSAALPGVPRVACFDTAFHARMPPEAFTYAVPARWREEYGVRRYGFHGLSHAYASRRAAELTGARRVVTAHLGSGASLAAVRDGVSVDTTMGFTPLEGMVMATRSGTVDPGLLLWLQTEQGMSAEELTDALFHRSGMTGLVGSADMRAVLDGARRPGSPEALGLAVYLHRLRAETAAMAAALGGMDALVLTGGVGERAAPVRSGAAAGLGFLGVEIDEARSDSYQRGDLEISVPGAPVRTLVIEAREDIEIARAARAYLPARAGG
ncbi:acetate kinase [Parafrankia colletiae]|uniref:Acetate kinase n=1 Tax=Parafrankia colletiae TaxID=573497 RepID=A0A1S1RE93_9ACTN|nr:acetate/propionate family kinase [Parafrankia colletiae]MCK9898569.1 acetate/propionate family kinase [Frankia sp. Cpl3]OHV44081.1 acetate kinase [Parafrankia colletiae]